MSIEEALEELEGHEENIRFQRLVVICTEFFGQPRISGSHYIFGTPWPGDPRVNLQNQGGKAKPYQVRQVIKALKKLKGWGD